MLNEKRRLSIPALATVVCLWAGSVPAQDSGGRAAGVTFLGDTGLWFVPTAEVMADGGMTTSGQVVTLNRQQGFSAIQSMAGTFAYGIRDRVEVFGSLPFLTRIDRDVRPLFRPEQPAVGGLLPDLPFATKPFSGNAVGDAIVGAKLNLATERSRAPAAVAVRGWARLSTGNRDAGTTAGALGGGLGLVVSKNLGGPELAAHADLLLRSDPTGFDLPTGLRWGVGLGAPVAGPLHLFGELVGEGVLSSEMLTEPLLGADGSLSGLESATPSSLDAVVGAQFQRRGVALGAGLTWAVRHPLRTSYDQVKPLADRLGLLFRVSYRPGVRTYAPTPTPNQPPNQPPRVVVACDPCEVMFGDEVRLRANATDADGDHLAFRWSAPAGSLIDARDRATTRWRAPAQVGLVLVTAVVSDGHGGAASDTTSILVKALPPPARRELVFEDVHFDLDRYNLRPGAARVLDDVVAAFDEDPDLWIQIEGHTCNIGTNEYNLALGERRANSIKEYLTTRGVPVDRLQTIAYGEERAAWSNAREETRRLNRRAALVVRMQPTPDATVATRAAASGLEAAQLVRMQPGPGSTTTR